MSTPVTVPDERTTHLKIDQPLTSINPPLDSKFLRRAADGIEDRGFFLSYILTNSPVARPRKTMTEADKYEVLEKIGKS